MFRPLSHRSRTGPAATAADGGPFDPFYRLNDDMSRLFDEALSSFTALSRFSGRGDVRAPRIDVHESADRIEIEAELPGVAEDHLDVQLGDEAIVIRGEKRSERKEEKDGGYRVLERSYGSFARTVPLPFPVDAEQVKAVFRDGVLRITLPKPAEQRRETRRVPINKE